MALFEHKNMNTRFEQPEYFEMSKMKNVQM